jgi:hypothetical protein
LFSKRTRLLVELYSLAPDDLKSGLPEEGVMGKLVGNGRGNGVVDRDPLVPEHLPGGVGAVYDA